MKAIFIALLSINLIFFVWQSFNKENDLPTQKTATAYRQIGNLETIEERNQKNKLAGLPLLEAKVKTEVGLPESAGAVSQSCEMIGPFAELIHAENLVEKLTAHQIESKVKLVEIIDGKNFWVYLKPEASDKEALRRLHEVQAKQVDEAFIISSGDLANGISFGQFSEERDAKLKLDAVRSHGYLPEIKEIPRSHSETWVEVREKEGVKLIADQWFEYMKEEKALERRQNYCFSVAN